MKVISRVRDNNLVVGRKLAYLDINPIGIVSHSEVPSEQFFNPKYRG